MEGVLGRTEELREGGREDKWCRVCESFSGETVSCHSTRLSVCLSAEVVSAAVRSICQ